MFLLQTDYKSEPHNTMCANISKDCIQHSTIPTASKARIIIWSISNNKKTSSDISRNRAQSLYWHLQISASCLPPVCASKVANKTNASGGETNLYLWFTWSSALVNTTTTRGKEKTSVVDLSEAMVIYWRVAVTWNMPDASGEPSYSI